MVASVHYQCLVKAGLAQSLPTSDVANSEVYDQVELFRDVVLARKGNWTRASWTRHSRVSESQHYMHVRTSTSWLSVLRYVLKQVCLRTTCAIIASPFIDFSKRAYTFCDHASSGLANPYPLIPKPFLPL